ncbi:MAG: ORF3 protein [Tadarida brasiliensis bat alphacoronavirus 1]|nr:MAG: ORF3 protein [Tadarida brasiliensis bat alphacoronavirus 1]
MIGGLFLFSLDQFINNTIEQQNLTTENAVTLRSGFEPVRQTVSFVGYTLTSIFVIFFATYQPSSHNACVAGLLARIVVMLVYGPVAMYLGAYVDGAIITITMLVRMAVVGYYTCRYKNFQFVLKNSTTLCFAFGKACNFDRTLKYADVLVFKGGPNDMLFGSEYVTFASSSDMYVAVRGQREFDLHLAKSIELSDGTFVYLFSREAAVSIFHSVFNEKLYEDAV